MNESKREFVERLVAKEELSSDYRQKYEKEVQAMLEKQITGIRRLPYIISLVIGLGLFVLLGIMVVIAPKEIPISGRAIFAAGAVFGLGFAGLSAWILMNGALNLKKHPTAMAGMSWGIAVIIITLAVVAAPRFDDPARGALMIVGALPCLVAAAAFMVSNRIDQAQMKTGEKLLEIEYRLADLADKIGQDNR
jgi:hypothetical protein